MITLNMDKTKVYILHLNLEGMNKIINEEDLFINEVKNNLDSITYKYTKINLFGIKFKWKRIIDTGAISICSNDKKWNISTEEFIKLYWKPV